jgi:tRNA pseudouridine38-40 synthase
MPTYRLTIAYDGSGFHGYARQPEVRTVQGELEAALFMHLGEVETSVAGRTDKGVHAAGQVVSFDVPEHLDEARLLRSLNRQLAPEIAAIDIRQVDPGFSARFSATGRAYVYRILNREAPDPFLATTTWHFATPLDRDAMNVASAAFIGEQDFASLCRKSGDRSTVRHVRAAEWVRHGDLLEFGVSASSFCHQMVRSMVAICVDVGRAKIDAADVPGILAAKDRHAARGAAPPHGLTLVNVEYA